MAEVLEFRGVYELNNWLKNKKFMSQYEIIPVPRMFESPETKKVVSVMTYVVVMS